MQFRVFDNDLKFVGHVDINPECGEHFCDDCGDCLHCYSGDGCVNGGEWDDNASHSHVIYLDKGQTFAEYKKSLTTDKQEK